jgi:hypothetical protein
VTSQGRVLLLALLQGACGGGAIPRDELPAEPIAFIQQTPTEGSLSLADLREALRIENPGDPESLRPRLETVLSLLVPSTGEVRPVPDARPGDLPLDWSPDGSRLLVGKSAAGTRRLELFSWNRHSGAWSRIVRDVAVSGGSLGDGPVRIAWGARILQARGAWSHGVRLVTDADGVIELAAARGGLDPDVARDGRSVLFVRPPQRADGEGVILLAESGAGEARPLGRGAQPRFSRDGRWIAFTRRRGENSDVWLMRADGSARRAITDSALYDEEYPSVSPDGAYVVYASARGARGESQLFLARLVDRREIQLTHRGQNTRPVW